MSDLAKNTFWSVLFVICVPIIGVTQTFELPEAHAGENYRVQIEQVLRDAYRLKLETRSQDAVIQWELDNGDLPPGLSVRTDGFILGKPDSSRYRAFAFRLRALDTAAKNDALIIEFVINLKSGGLRLVKFEGPTLRPVDESGNQSEATGTIDAGAVTLPAAAPQEGQAPLSWVEPDVRDGATISNHTESLKSLGVKVAPSSKICLLDILVLRNNDGRKDNRLVDHLSKRVDYNQPSQNFVVRLAPGDNHIVVTPYTKKKENQSCDQDTDLNTLTEVSTTMGLIVECEGNNCGKAPKAIESDPAMSNRSMRAILGIEQSGASSAASAQNPFLDFFFNAQLAPKHWLAWGNVRLTTTPQQVTAFASSATNAVGAATADKINDLATSFDFKIGPEFQLNPNDNTRVSLIAGFGAISTLTGPPKSGPIFKLPSNTSVQYANFIEQYTEAKTPGAAYITFVPMEQDRFFRQYFMGLRVKSYHGDRFPSMFDVTFGQNSAVTGGKLRHFVLGFDGSHELPIKGGAISIFGSANLKMGGPKFRNTPFVLDPAEATVKLSDPTVVITSRQSNRDFYRIGFGIDLIGLFKEKKKVD